MMDKKCKYYTPHLETVKKYVKCLYQIEGCSCGGLLHILLDDDNYEDEDILFCLKECLNHPEREESKLGILICEEYLKLSMPQRTMLDNMINGMNDVTCLGYTICDICPIVGKE